MVLFYQNFKTSKGESKPLDDSCYKNVVLKPGLSFTV
jgi:hypothetical protein